MSKKIFFVVALVIAGASLSAQIVSAQSQGNADASATQTEITVDGSGIENPGLLPTSPFYFLKEWGRAIQKVFTFNPVRKAELELEDANQRAAEIKKLEEVAPQNIEAIGKAIDRYKGKVDSLKARLTSLKETVQNPNVDKLLDKLTERSLRHIELFENLKLKFENNDLKQEMDTVRDKLDDVIKDVPQHFEGPEAFKERLQKVIGENRNGILENLRATEVLDRISEKLPVEAKAKITEVKDNLIQEIGEQVNKLKSVDREKIFNMEALKQLPGDALRRMDILDAVKSDLKDLKVINKIQEFKNNVLEENSDQGEKESVMQVITTPVAPMSTTTPIINKELNEE